MINSFKSWLWESWFAAFRPNRTKSPTDIYQNPTLRQLQKIQEGGQARAIFAGDRVYAWNPTTALHDEVMRKLNLGGSAAAYAVIFPQAKLVQVVAGSQLQVSHLQSHPYVTRMRFEVEAVSNYGA